MNIKPTLLLISLALISIPAWSSEYTEPLTELAKSKLRALASNPSIISSINSQNKVHSQLSQTAIDKLDGQWRKEVDSSSGPLIDKILSKPLSKELQAVVEQEEGLFTEIFAMDNRGLNVGQSNLTSDYWQGDEAKWQQTFMLGADSVHISDVEFDESSQSYQAQVSLSVTDPESGLTIGAVTFGINADAI